MKTTSKTHTAKKMDRRSFLRLGGLAAAGMAWWLAACGTPVTDEPVAIALDDAGPAPAQGDDSPQTNVTTPTPQPVGGVACPLGLLNDPYPGRCKRYVDGNGNGVCDYSEPGSGDRSPRPTG